MPNLVWWDSRGGMRENSFDYVPTALDNVMTNHYGNIIHSVLRYRDLASYIPFQDWLRYPITAVITCRGCTENCVICGGSAAAFRQFYNRGQPVFRSPQVVARDVRNIGRFSNGPIFILGDLCQPGNGYAGELLSLLQKDGVKNQIIFELFSPAPRDLLQQMSLTSPGFCLEISPESHDPEVREASGRHFSTESLEQTLADVLDAGCGRLDVFFMVGLPKQTPKSVMDTVDYCGSLLDRFKGDKRLCLFIVPLSPFLDPGSLGFEHPERYGYRVRFRTLAEHRQALVSPSWKYSLNYETEWMDRQQIADTAYEAILRLNRLKASYGVVSKRLAETGEQRILAARDMMYRIDELLASGRLEAELPRLKPEVDRINMFPVAEKTQLELPLGLIRLKPWRSLWSWLTGRW